MESKSVNEWGFSHRPENGEVLRNLVGKGIYSEVDGDFWLAN